MLSVSQEFRAYWYIFEYVANRPRSSRESRLLGRLFQRRVVHVSVIPPVPPATPWPLRGRQCQSPRQTSHKHLPVTVELPRTSPTAATGSSSSWPTHSRRCGLLEIRYGTRMISSLLAVPRPRSISSLQAPGQLAVETHSLCHSEPLVGHLLLEIMRKAIACCDCPIGPCFGPTRLDKLAPPR
jgi:hypothetical protein